MIFATISMEECTKTEYQLSKLAIRKKLNFWKQGGWSEYYIVRLTEETPAPRIQINKRYARINEAQLYRITSEYWKHLHFYLEHWRTYFCFHTKKRSIFFSFTNKQYSLGAYDQPSWFIGTEVQLKELKTDKNLWRNFFSFNKLFISRWLLWGEE